MGLHLTQSKINFTMTSMTSSFSSGLLGIFSVLALKVLRPGKIVHLGQMGMVDYLHCDIQDSIIWPLTILYLYVLLFSLFSCCCSHTGFPLNVSGGS